MAEGGWTAYAVPSTYNQDLEIAFFITDYRYKHSRDGTVVGNNDPR
jgi:hypothetical protein